MSAVYDAGALLAAERGDRRLLSLHLRLMQRGHRPIVPVAVLAQVWRRQAGHSLGQLLRGCHVEAMDEDVARHAGRLLGSAGRSDVVDAVVVLRALTEDLPVLTCDRRDLLHLASAAGRRLAVIDV